MGKQRPPWWWLGCGNRRRHSPGPTSPEPQAARGSADDQRQGGGASDRVGAPLTPARTTADRPQHGACGGSAEQPGRDDFHYWEQQFQHVNGGEPDNRSCEWYRQQPPETREVNVAHASALTRAFVWESAHSPQGDLLVIQLATDLSGRYGRYLIVFHGDHALRGSPDGIDLQGRIFEGGQQVGTLQISCSLDPQRALVVVMGIEDLYGRPMTDRAHLYAVLRDALGPYLARSQAVEIDAPFLTADTAEAVAELADANEPLPGSREWYRLQNIDTRAVDTEHARALAEVDNAAPATYCLLLRQLAEDLSGRYGPYLVRFLGSPWPNGMVNLYGRIVKAGEEFGRVQLCMDRDERGHFVAALKVEGIDGVGVTDGVQLYTVLADTLRSYLQRSNVVGCENHSLPPPTKPRQEGGAGPRRDGRG